MKSVVIKFGLLSVAFLMLMELSRFSVYTKPLKQELLISGVAILFIALGFYLHKALAPKKTNTLVQDPNVAAQLGLSDREQQVLNEMAKGKSNREIAADLFIAETTVKTHVSNILSKLGAKRRTEAVQIARENGLFTS